MGRTFSKIHRPIGLPKLAKLSSCQRRCYQFFVHISTRLPVAHSDTHSGSVEQRRGDWQGKLIPRMFLNLSEERERAVSEPNPVLPMFCGFGLFPKTTHNDSYLCCKSFFLPRTYQFLQISPVHKEICKDVLAASFSCSNNIYVAINQWIHTQRCGSYLKK